MAVEASRKKSARRKSGEARIRFTAKLQRPKATADDGDVSWTFLNLPKKASAELPSRGMVSVEGAINGAPFTATLQPDGAGGHWLKVDRKLRETAKADAGESVDLEIAPLPPEREPEPELPEDLGNALASASAKTREAWSDITPAARRDFIHWIVSARKAETRVKRIAAACDMLAKGKRRPCCFDRSGMYCGGGGGDGRSMSCPVAE